MSGMNIMGYEVNISLKRLRKITDDLETDAMQRVVERSHLSALAIAQGIPPSPLFKECPKCGMPVNPIWDDVWQCGICGWISQSPITADRVA